MQLRDGDGWVTHASELVMVKATCLRNVTVGAAHLSGQ